MALYPESEDMITVGAYQKGSNPQLDIAIDAHALIEQFLIQGEFEPSSIEETIKALSQLTNIPISNEEWQDEERIDMYNSLDYEKALILEND